MRKEEKNKRHSTLSVIIMIGLSIGLIYLLYGVHVGIFIDTGWVKFTIISYGITALAWCLMDESVK